MSGEKPESAAGSVPKYLHQPTCAVPKAPHLDDHRCTCGLREAVEEAFYAYEQAEPPDCEHNVPLDVCVPCGEKNAAEKIRRLERQVEHYRALADGLGEADALVSHIGHELGCKDGEDILSRVDVVMRERQSALDAARDEQREKIKKLPDEWRAKVYALCRESPGGCWCGAHVTAVGSR